MPRLPGPVTKPTNGIADVIRSAHGMFRIRGQGRNLLPVAGNRPHYPTVFVKQAGLHSGGCPQDRFGPPVGDGKEFLRPIHDNTTDRSAARLCLDIPTESGRGGYPP